ncbi:MAG: hypothetical protein NTX22_10685 [Ignavibacteriales bacterium]|nr:hypothetical protein [Ignavibacteriales bacterium]
MTRIILESKNYNDVLLIKELANRLNIKIAIQDLSEQSKNIDQLSVNADKIIAKGVDISNFGDPTVWQSEVRQSRNFNFD